MKNIDWLSLRAVTSIFALISFVGGFYFLNNSMTGNAIVNNPNYVNFISIIGILLIFCSLILVAHSIKKR
jgi:hypothetical protein